MAHSANPDPQRTSLPFSPAPEITHALFVPRPVKDRSVPTDRMPSWGFPSDRRVSVTDESLDQRASLLAIKHFGQDPTVRYEISDYERIKDFLRHGKTDKAEDHLKLRCKVLHGDAAKSRFSVQAAGTRSLSYGDAVREASKLLATEGVGGAWEDNPRSAIENLSRAVIFLDKDSTELKPSDPLMRQAIGKAYLPYLALQFNEFSECLRLLDVYRLIPKEELHLIDRVVAVVATFAKVATRGLPLRDNDQKVLALALATLEKLRSDYPMIQEALALTAHGYSLDPSTNQELLRRGNPSAAEILEYRSRTPPFNRPLGPYEEVVSTFIGELDIDNLHTLPELQKYWAHNTKGPVENFESTIELLTDYAKNALPEGSLGQEALRYLLLQLGELRDSVALSGNKAIPRLLNGIIDYLETDAWRAHERIPPLKQCLELLVNLKTDSAFIEAEKLVSHAYSLDEAENSELCRMGNPRSAEILAPSLPGGSPDSSSPSVEGLTSPDTVQSSLGSQLTRTPLAIDQAFSTIEEEANAKKPSLNSLTPSPVQLNAERGVSRRVYDDGRVEEGHFVNGQLEGMGRRTHPDGRMERGRFKQGVLLPQPPPPPGPPPPLATRSAPSRAAPNMPSEHNKPPPLPPRHPAPRVVPKPIQSEPPPPLPPRSNRPAPPPPPPR
ncbi:MAG: hypothetical protein ACOYKZ_00770 [Chlamydiia bacterium]